MSDEDKTLSFKVEVIWKIVLLGLVALGSRLSWQAWQDTQDTLKYAIETLGDHETRLTVNELRIQRNEMQLDEDRRRK